jgi:hypothetical protein
MPKTEELMSIKAFAEAAGRSQQTIYKQIGTRLAPYVHEKDGQKWIERRALGEVFKIGVNQPNKPENNSDSTKELNGEQLLYASMQTTIDVLQSQIRTLEEQIKVKDQQISDLSERLRDSLEIEKARIVMTATDKQLPPTSEEIQEAKEDPEKKPGVFAWFKRWWN